MLRNSFHNAIQGFNGEQTLIGSLIVVLAYVYGMVSTPLFWIFVILSFIDYTHGIYAAWKLKQLDWDKCLEGIIGKIFITILIVVSALIDFTLSYFQINTQGIFHNLIMSMLIGRELGSIIKNRNKAKLWVPKLMKDAHKKINNITDGINKK